jgi:enamine deaminase RidA (YjgF/YER057c/UK114 family)
VSFVQGKLPIAGVQVAIDAVAAVPCKPGRVGVELLTEPVIPGHRGPVGAILPASRVIHIAGQAEQGGDAKESTRNTLSHLRRTLEWQGAGWKDAVSIKCFLTPIESAPMVIEEVRAACGENHSPVVFVEWQSGLPIEIEVVANVGSVPLEPNGADAVRYLTPPDMTASPVYSRVAVTGGGPMIYVSGLLAEERAAADPESETRDLFRQLREILSDPACGSDLKHLVKATYYCSHDSTSSALNGVRPDYYDPARPPAASKAIVPGVGHAGRKITLDMIAVRRSDR